MQPLSAMRWPGLSLATVLLLSALAPATSVAQQWPTPPPKSHRAPPTSRALPDSLARVFQRLRDRIALLPAPSVALAAGSLVDEGEPNDSLSLATVVTFGDTITGVIDPAGDVDFFAVDLTAGDVIDIDVDAQVLGSSLDSYIGLFDADTNFIGSSDDVDGLDSRIIYPVPVTGRYWIGIVDYSLGGGPGYTYRLALGAFALDETEPNDDATTANLVALDDTTTAAVAGSDVDYFAVDVPAGTYLGVSYVPVASWVELEVSLYGTDGATLLVRDSIYYLPELRHWVEAAGRYYVSVRGVYGSSGLYGLSLRPLPTGPGDPTTPVAGGFGYPAMAVAGLAGQTYVLDGWNSRLQRVSASGTVSTLTENVYANDMIVDGYGDILATGWDQQTGQPVIRRITDGGQESVFASDSAYGYALAVDADGDVWQLGCGSTCPRLTRFDPTGKRKSSAAVNFYASRMAFSPAGVLHLLDGSRVMTLAGTTVQTVIDAPGTTFTSIAFDEDGYLYLGTDWGEIALYGPSYQVVNRPFAATNLGFPYPTFAFFARDAGGAMTSRLQVVGSDPTAEPIAAGMLLEANPSGVRAAGYPPQPRLLRLAADALSPGTMGTAYADTLRVLDGAGPFTWQIVSGALPPGIELGAATGVLSGVPAADGTFTFTTRADGNGRFGVGTFTLSVGEPTLVVSDIVSALLGVLDVLSPDEERFLDLQGNRNGHMDIGDVRAYLRARGQLPTSIAALLERKEDR